MADPALLAREQVQVGQAYRLMFWELPEYRHFSEASITRQLANIHLIPANTAIRAQLLHGVQLNQLIYLEGQLVHVTPLRSEWPWYSSLTRDDTWHHASEILWVERVAAFEPARLHY